MEYNILLLNNLIDFIYFVSKIDFYNLDDKKYKNYMNKIKKMNKFLIYANENISKMNKNEIAITFLNMIGYKESIEEVIMKINHIKLNDEKANNIKNLIVFHLENLNTYYNNLYYYLSGDNNY